MQIPCECAPDRGWSLVIGRVLGNVDRIVKEVHCEERVITRVGDGEMCSEARAVLKRYRLLSRPLT
jgi:hypothetical protein